MVGCDHGHIYKYNNSSAKVCDYEIRNSCAQCGKLNCTSNPLVKTKPPLTPKARLSSTSKATPKPPKNNATKPKSISNSPINAGEVFDACEAVAVKSALIGRLAAYGGMNALYIAITTAVGATQAIGSLCSSTWEKFCQI
ncbi:hypothetical protein F8M41_022896 [Gigaspora margarita]|uniref:Uncharacterized protein n=1 Tax=Gigaspora margarita TaxID=4874 RepID=A0A8H4AEC7_GIGMA|nr:hypothetical protein F8M41_022896 [Gigaspora margarita]